MPPLSEKARAIVDAIDFATVALFPLKFRCEFDPDSTYWEIQRVYQKHRAELYFSPTRNVHVLPIYVPGGDWRKPENFTTESRGQWQKSSFTALADEMPQFREFVTHHCLPWATPTYRVLLVSPVDTNGTPLHQDAFYGDDIRRVFKPRLFLSGKSAKLAYVCKDGSEIVADTRSKWCLLNGALPHRAAYDGDEDNRRFILTAGTESVFSDDTWDYLLDSYIENRDQIVRVPLEQQFDPKMIHGSYTHKVTR